MRIAVPREIMPGENRVALVPEIVAKLVKSGLEVAVEAGAGARAMFTDEAYRQAGATIVPGARELYAGADVVLKLREPVVSDALGAHEADLIREGATLIAFLGRDAQSEAARKLAARGVTAFSMEMIPRISRAQKMDALSSMSTVAGYKAVLMGAAALGKFFPLLMTAAGTIAPARVFVLGAGVAGLQAIATARRLGAVVEAFDVRPAVRDEVQSLGATFVGHELLDEAAVAAGGYAKEMSPAFIAAEMALFAAQAKEVDVIITTALIPGRRAPILVTEEMVASMKPGSVIVDLAAEQQGNCALTVPGEAAVRHGVTILGFTDMASRMAEQASQLYGVNLCHLLTDMGGAAGWKVDFDDEVVRGMTVVKNGEITWPPPKAPEPPPRPPEAKKADIPARVAKAPPSRHRGGPGHSAPTSPPSAAQTAMLAVTGLCLLGIGTVAPATFLTHLTVFVLAVFIGYQVVWNVTPALHTPLMSVTNAISGIILIGGMAHLASPGLSGATWLGALAVLIAFINVAGGFLVTARMLKMFHR